MNKRIFVFWTLIILIYQVGFSTYLSKDYREAEAIEEPLDYEYTPLVRDGVMWKYVHSGMNYDFTEPYVSETYCYISGTVEVDGKVYHKCFVENTNLDDVCVAYLREEDKRVYMMSVWEDSDREIYFYNTNGKEELIYDFNLNVGDTYSSYITDLEVKNVKYEEVDGTVRKIYEVYGERKFENSYTESNLYTIVEGIGVTDGWGGLFCFPYIQDFLGAPYPVYDQQIFHEYTPLVREGVVWEYFHNGWTPDQGYYSRIYISGEEGINNTIYHKCYIVNPYSKNECIAYLREEDKKVYLLSLDQNVVFQYNTNGQEILIYDFNLNEGDSYSIEIEGDVYDMKVVKVEYENVDGELCKTFEIYNKEINDYYTITEGIGVVGEHDGFFCFPYAPMVTGKGNPIYIRQDIYEYTPLVREGAEWGYFIGDTAEEVDFYRLRLSGEEEINGNIYKKCWCYTDCEFDESTAVLYGYLREEDKRVYVLYQNAGSEYLLYDFNLQEGDEYGQHPWFNGAVTLPIESVDYVLTTEGLRKRYFVGSNVCYIEGIGIVGTHLGDMLRPNDYPYVENATFNYEKNQGNNVVYQQTDNEIGFTDPCINYGASYEYTPLVEDGKVWHYTESWGWLAVIDNARVAMRGQDVINGKVYTKCWLYYDHCEFSEDDAMLLCYMREEDKRVYMIPAVDSEHCPSFFLGYESYASDIADAQEYLLYDFNLSAGDSYCEVPDYNNEWLYHTIESVDFIEIDGKLRKKYVLSNSHNVIEGVGIVGSSTGYVCSPNPVLPTYEYTTPRLSHITLDNETIFLYYGGDPCLSNDDPNTIKVEKIGDLTLYQTGDVVTIGGAIGKVDMAIYVLDGVKLAEASGNGSATLLTYELPIGIYVVKATDSTGNRLTQKIVVK